MLQMRRLAVVVVVVFLGGGLPLSAEPLRPGDVLRVTFNLTGLLDANQDLPIETFDALEFIPGANEVEPVGSYTTRLLDRGTLLGTHVGGSRAAFKSPTSVFNRANPTVIDFSSFQDGSFDGAIEVTIDRGLVDLIRLSDELISATPSPI